MTAIASHLNLRLDWPLSYSQITASTPETFTLFSETEFSSSCLNCFLDRSMYSSSVILTLCTMIPTLLEKPSCGGARKLATVWLAFASALGKAGGTQVNL